jgi:dihydrofolate reductase
MSTLQYQTAMSLDGFIAGPGGDMSWMSGFSGPNPAVQELIESTGSLLVGRTTFGGDDPGRGTTGEGEPYGGGWKGQQFVLTHRPPAAEFPGVTFVGDLETGIAAARAAAGGRNVGILGADVARQCVEAGVLEEIYICLVPVLLGEGTRLFVHEGGMSVRLERVSVDPAPEVTNFRFRVVR